MHGSLFIYFTTYGINSQRFPFLVKLYFITFEHSVPFTRYSNPKISAKNAAFFVRIDGETMNEKCFPNN